MEHYLFLGFFTFLNIPLIHWQITIGREIVHVRGIVSILVRQIVQTPAALVKYHVLMIATMDALEVVMEIARDHVYIVVLNHVKTIYANLWKQ